MAKKIKENQEILEITDNRAESPKINNEINDKIINEVNIPPKVIIRNKYGLINDESIKYTFFDDGLVNWKALIPKEYIVPNKQLFTSRNKPIPESIDGLKDNELLTLLGGSRFLAQTRGFNSIRYNTTSPNENYVVSVCEIEWIGNYETEFRTTTFSAIGDASPNNTSSFCKNYLGPIAENRAFVRAVRNFLRIPILSQEEIGGTIIDTQTEEKDGPRKMLSELLTKHSIPFDKLKATLIKENFDGANAFTSISDIPNYRVFSLIGRIKDKYEKNLST